MTFPRSAGHDGEVIANVVRTSVQSLVCLAAAAVSCAVVRAGGPEENARPEAIESLLRLVGDDAALSLEITAPARDWNRLHRSEMVRRAQQTTLYREWSESDDALRLAQTRADLEKLTGQPLGKFLDGLFGKGVVLALYADGREKPAGVLLTMTDGPEAVRAAWSALDRAEPRTTVARKQHRDVDYYVRQPERGRDPVCHATLGNVLVLSDRETMIHKAIELSREPADSPRTLWNAPGFVAMRANRPEQTAAVLYVNARAWDHAWGQDDAGARILSRWWARIESVRMSLVVEDGLACEFVCRYSLPENSARWRESIRRIDGEPEFLASAPADALAVVAGRHDLSAWADAANLPQNEKLLGMRRVAANLMFGLDPFDSVLPHLPPNWGLAILAHDRGSGNPLPVDLVGSVELPPDGTESGAAIRKGVNNAVATGLNLLAVMAAGEAVAPSLRRDGDLLWVEPVGPLAPAFHAAGRYLVASTAPAAVRRLTAQDTGPSLNTLAPFRRLREKYFPRASQVAYVNLAAVRDLLRQRESALIEQTAAAERVEPAEAARRVRRVTELTEIVDDGFAAAEIDEQRLRIVFGVSTRPAGDARRPAR